jgi:glycosyltransferase involved in cell wall biosynthesis
VRPTRDRAIAATQRVLGALWAGHHAKKPMRVVMTLLARNEADIVAATIEHALAIGVDFIVATDHRSDDGTTEILRDYSATGRLELFEETSDRFAQARWVSGMARRAATVHGASWVINHDADEFLWPEGLALKAALAEVEPEAGLVGLAERRFAEAPGRTGGWSELDVASFPGNVWGGTNYWKVSHRADPGVRVLHGNHFAYGPRIGGISRRPPLEVLHFPERSLTHYVRKLELTATVLADRGIGLRNEVAELRRGYFDQVYFSRLKGVADRIKAGTAIIDTRLRDRLHALLPTAVLPRRLEEALQGSGGP